MLLILLGNKADLAAQRQVSNEEAREYAAGKGIMFFEVSARAGTNIVQAFNELAKKLTGIETNPNYQNEVKSTGFNLGTPQAQTDVKSGKEGKTKKKGCC